MIKKAFLLLSLLFPVSLMAQLGVGSWQVYPTFQNVDKLLETPDKVYCLSAGSLMSYDMDKNETYNYGVNNILTEVGIKNIYYNPDGKYLLVVYNSAGMDVIYDNGKMISLPDIKDAIMNTVSVINDVAFAPGKIIVATNFGLVIYDDKKMEVKQTGNYGRNITVVGATDQYIAAYNAQDKVMWLIKMGDKINNTDKFITLADGIFSNKAYSLTGLKDCTFVIETDYYQQRRPCLISYDFTTNSLGSQVFLDVVSKDSKPSKNGHYFYGDDKIVSIDNDSNVSAVMLPAVLQKQNVAYWDDPSRLWCGDGTGIAQYSISDGQITVLNDRIKGDALVCTKVGRITVSPSGKIYVSHNSFSNNHLADWPSNVDSYINVIENGNIYDVTPYDENGKTLLNSTAQIQEDLNDPSTYYIGSIYNGIYKVKDGKIVNIFDKSNSTLVPLYGNDYRILALDYDRDGNLWVGRWWSTLNPSCHIHRVGAQALKKDNTAVGDWNKMSMTITESGGSDLAMVVCKKSNAVIYSYKWSKGLAFMNTKGTLSTSDDVPFRLITKFTDQDGKTIDFTTTQEIAALFEDSRGRVWVGHEQGIFMIPNPEDFDKADFRIQRIKVPRNDGSNFADYLLDAENVLCIAEDGIGRKWIGTLTSGAYLVNENGTEILEHFTPDNSMLTTNTIYAVGCDPNSNSVYFGTVDGLFRYNSDSAPGASDYSDVYAYPNPVRPEYTGWITVKGLMDDSLVKIADAAGNVFHQGRSNGGIFVWDGCDASGNRVKTGVYYVFASQGGSEGTSSSAAVTKILVVN